MPTGIENVRAAYRSGLGFVGNVDVNRIDQLVGPPLGVKGVINPLPATGGADPDPEELIREHAPLGLSALDRVVSTQDYADFARTFAGIGKATASLIDGVVYLTIAGMRSDPLPTDSLLVRNLDTSLRDHGDPLQQFKILSREVVLLFMRTRVAIKEEHQWQDVELRIRHALLDRFSYERARFGQDILRSDAITTVQNVEGVVYVDIDVFWVCGERCGRRWRHTWQKEGA